LIEVGALQPIRVGTQRQGFLSTHLVRFLWSRRQVPTREPAPAPKPQTSKQLNPPRGRGRRRVGGPYRVSS
jgi:hypothetical protein